MAQRKLNIRSTNAIGVAGIFLVFSVGEGDNLFRQISESVKPLNDNFLLKSKKTPRMWVGVERIATAMNPIKDIQV